MLLLALYCVGVGVCVVCSRVRGLRFAPHLPNRSHHRTPRFELARGKQHYCAPLRWASMLYFAVSNLMFPVFWQLYISEIYVFETVLFLHLCADCLRRSSGDTVVNRHLCLYELLPNSVKATSDGTVDLTVSRVSAFDAARNHARSSYMPVCVLHLNCVDVGVCLLCSSVRG